MQRILTLLRRITTPPEWIPDHGVRSFVLNSYMITFAFCGHTLFIPVFYLLGNPLCFYNNIAAVFIDALSLYLNYRGRFRSVYILFTSLITYHASVCHLSFGSEAGFIFYFPALAVFIFIFRRFRYLRFIMFSIMSAVFIIQYISLQINPVQYPDTVIPSWLIYFFNACASLFSIGYLATFFSLAADRAEGLLLSAKSRAEEGRRAKSLFLANMSHEIRTPLNSVAGMITLSLGTEDEKRRREFLHIAKDSADHLITVINDILDYSKIEEHKMVLYTESFDIRHLVQNTVKALDLGIARGDVEMTFEISEDIPRILEGDPYRIRQVLINLISNAIKFTEHGVITLRVESRARSGGVCVTGFTVSDSGAGIPEDLVDSIFGSFVQLEGSGGNRGKGTGLGLAIVKELVELMGGSISVKSIEGEGSSFSFDLPLVEAEESAVSAVRETDSAEFAANKGIKILVAEDDRINSLLIEEYLKKLGYRYKVVHSGRGVLEELESSYYDLVLMDIEMADMGGVQALNLIRTVSRAVVRDIPVAAMTGYYIGDLETGNGERGFTCCITKPFDLRELERAIQNCIDNSGAENS